MRFEGKAGLLHLAVLLSGTREGIAIADVERGLDGITGTADLLLIHDEG